MSIEHPISDEVLDLTSLALIRGEHWMAYNSSLYFIDKDDVHFFKNETDAKEFAINNISDRDSYRVLYFNSILDIYKQISYLEKAENQLIINPDANGLYNYEGNAFTDELINHIEGNQLSLCSVSKKTL
jgi:hypothetical protein